MDSHRNPDRRQWEIAEQVHDAALHPAQWHDALTTVADYLGVDGCQCLAMAQDADHVPFGAVGRIDPAAQTDYEAHYFALDFRRPRYLNYTPYAIFSDRDITTDAERRSSPFHQEFLVKYDCENLLLANFPLGGAMKGMVIVGRSARHPDFAPGTRRALTQLLPAFRNSIQVRLEMQRLQSHAHALESVLDDSGVGVMLLDRTGRVLYANAEARRILAPGDCLRVRQDRLVPVGVDAANRYAALLHALQQRGSSATAMAPVPLRIKRLADTPGVDLLLRPVSCLGWPTPPAEARFAVHLVDSAAVPPDVRALLRMMFGFTEAEAGVANRLRQGLSVEAIADSHAVATATVRAHLRNLFTKTNTRRQGELIAHLHHALLAWVGSTPEAGRSARRREPGTRRPR